MPQKPTEPDLAIIDEPSLPEESQSLESREEAIDWDVRAKAESVRRLTLENRQIEQDRTERRTYAHRVFCLICIWLSTVFLLLLVQGLRYYTWFELSDPILITVVGTTTGSVLGIFLIVVNYLFPKRKE